MNPFGHWAFHGIFWKLIRCCEHYAWTHASAMYLRSLHHGIMQEITHSITKPFWCYSNLSIRNMKLTLGKQTHLKSSKMIEECEVSI